MSEQIIELKLDVDATRQSIRDQLFDGLHAAQLSNIENALAQAFPEAEHFHNVGEVNRAIEGLSLSRVVKEHAKAVYQVLAEAEASVHGCTVEETHFHEVGNAEAVRNVLAICLALEALAPEKIIATPVQTGQGKVKCAHGLLDIPAPATAAIIARGIPVVAICREGEWCTPTSAAIILHFVDEFV
jgi:pyridinium-3,5-bisthiocarboxylic acid mononucleotide nickel chelatase